jgi:hypothetical protein
MMFHVHEEHRRKTGRMASTAQNGNNGVFVVPPLRGGRWLYCIVSDGMGWDHVSVHVLDGKKTHTPTWSEMCYVKEIFWDDEDVVMQLHPKRSEYVNNHPNVLHLWRPTSAEIPTPPRILVGI